MSGRELWFLTGSQHLYGETAIKQVGENSRKIVDALNASGRVSVKIVHKPVMTGPAEQVFEVEINMDDLRF